MKKEALLYEKIDHKTRCKVCQRRCSIEPGNRGYCLTRENIHGKIYSLIYGSVSSSAVDPVEKKPLFHFYPGSLVYSLGSVGCNFRCKYCQNWTISQALINSIETREIMPEDAVATAKECNCKAIAWTYNEPTLWLEYTLDSAKLAHKNNLKTIYVTNGYQSLEALEIIVPNLDAANVDLKGMSDRFYRQLCNARVDPVLENILWMYDQGIHLEITNLIIPGYNDSEESLRDLVNFISQDLGMEVPLHFTRFMPHYKMSNVPPTPLETLLKAQKMAKDAGIKHVYVGNVPGIDGENTFCWNCGELLIERNGFGIGLNKLKTLKKCFICGAKIDLLN